MVELNNNTVPMIRSSSHNNASSNNNPASSEETMASLSKSFLQQQPNERQSVAPPTTTAQPSYGGSYNQYNAYYANYLQYYSHIDQSIRSGSWSPVLELFENLMVYFRNFAHTDSYRSYLSGNIFNSAIKIYEQLFVEAVEVFVSIFRLLLKVKLFCCIARTKYKHNDYLIPI